MDVFSAIVSNYQLNRSRVIGEPDRGRMDVHEPKILKSSDPYVEFLKTSEYLKEREYVVEFFRHGAGRSKLGGDM
jgi:hypothetical protein